MDKKPKTGPNTSKNGREERGSQGDLGRRYEEKGERGEERDTEHGTGSKDQREREKMQPAAQRSTGGEKEDEQLIWEEETNRTGKSDKGSR